jgi:S1-C subfamily serine protease
MAHMPVTLLQYSVNIAKKIVNDIVEFGDVQRGYLGIQYASNLNEIK